MPVDLGTLEKAMSKVIALARCSRGTEALGALPLAAALGQLGENVLIVDLAGRPSVAVGGGSRAWGPEFSDPTCSVDSLSPVVCATEFRGVDFVRGREILAEPTGSLAAAGRTLKLRLEGPWTSILLDCPPGVGTRTRAALAASWGVVVPTEAHAVDFEGMAELVGAIQRARESSGNTDLRFLGVIPCITYPRRVSFQEGLAQLEEAFPGKVSPLVVCHHPDYEMEGKRSGAGGIRRVDWLREYGSVAKWLMSSV